MAAAPKQAGVVTTATEVVTADASGASDRATPVTVIASTAKNVTTATVHVRHWPRSAVVSADLEARV